MFLREVFDEQYDEESFRAMADEIREACWSAYSGMQEIKEEMDDEPTGVGLLEALDAWPSEVRESQEVIKETLALSQNLHQEWLGCKAMGLALLCMANEFGDPDPNQDLAAELMG